MTSSHLPPVPSQWFSHLASALDELRALGDRRTQAELLLAAATDLGAAADSAAARRWLVEAAALAAQVAWREGEEPATQALARLSPPPARR